MRYRVLEKSFIGNSIREAGETVDYDGEPGPNLEPLAEPPPAPAAARKARAAPGDEEPAS